MTNSNTQRRQIHLLSPSLGCEKQLFRMAQQQPFNDTSDLPHSICHIWRTYNQILVSLVWWLPLLFPSTHEPPSGDDTWFNLGKMHLHHHTFLSGIPVTNFRHSVARSTYFEEDFSLYIGLGWGHHQLGLLRIPGSSSSKVCLVLFPLSVCKIRSFIRVERQTQSTFERSEMVA